VCDAAILTLGTGYAIGCLVALVLNAVLPYEEEDGEDDMTDPEMMTNMISKNKAESSSEDDKKSAEEASEGEA